MTSNSSKLLVACWGDMNTSSDVVEGECFRGASITVPLCCGVAGVRLVPEELKTSCTCVC